MAADSVVLGPGGNPVSGHDKKRRTCVLCEEGLQRSDPRWLAFKFWKQRLNPTFHFTIKPLKQRENVRDLEMEQLATLR